MADSSNAKILDFWNERASLGDISGTNDFILTEIERKYLLNAIPKGAHVLDVGCGNGGSLIDLRKAKHISGVGFDFSEKMVESAQNNVRESGFGEHIKIYHRSVPPVSNEWGEFPIVYSQRCLINLQNVGDQKDAVASIYESLEVGGIYIMLECFNDGGEQTNILRKFLGLEPILAPWHNLFFNMSEIKSWSSDKFMLERIDNISSTYHFISRVVYAKLAHNRNEPLIYDSEINKIAARLPQDIGEFGPVKACIWRKVK